jgi:HSP20 family molecular chaperone IbpA
VKRIITLPAALELEKVEAVYRNGMLEVHVPREPEAVGRRIEVKT